MHSETHCPFTHPYVYARGEQCCKVQWEKIAGAATCDGGRYDLQKIIIIINNTKFMYPALRAGVKAPHQGGDNNNFFLLKILLQPTIKLFSDNSSFSQVNLVVYML